MRALRAEGMTQAEIARATGWGLRAVERHTSGYGGPPRGVTEEEAEQMRALQARGLTQLEIARRIGRHERTVHRYVKGSRGPQRGVKPADVAEMLRLAKRGLGRSDIAAITEWSVKTVGRHVGHVVPRRDINRPPDLERYRRMIAAAESAEYGTSHELARRFGLKNADTLWVTLVRARRIVAGANKQEAA